MLTAEVPKQQGGVLSQIQCYTICRNQGDGSPCNGSIHMSHPVAIAPPEGGVDLRHLVAENERRLGRHRRRRHHPDRVVGLGRNSIDFIGAPVECVHSRYPRLYLDFI